MDIKLELYNNKGFNWYTKNNTYVKGFAFNKSLLLKEDTLVDYLLNIKSKDEFEKKIIELNGSFVVIIKEENNIYCAVDRLRSIPIFFRQSNEEILITDTVAFNNFPIDKQSSEYYEFLLSGYIIGNSTLIKDYRQLQASELLYLESESLVLQKYFRHTHQNFLSIEYPNYFKDLSAITDGFIKRLIKSVDDKTIVIPLSGGYDSRYILAGLRKQGFDNVICYTYGGADSFEVDVATKVAKILDYKIHVIEYTDEKWVKLLDNDCFHEYVEYSFNYSSLPHIQDFIALEELKNILPEQSVIVPGFCGDLLGGSYIPVEVKENKINSLLKQKIDSYILNRHFPNMKLNIPSRIREKLLQRIRECIKVNINNIKDVEEYISLNESFFTEHKVAKFVVNSLRVYEYYGYEWRMPLWDNDLMEYWYKIPYQLRISGKLYNDFLFDSLFNKLNIGFKKKKPISHNGFIVKVRKYLPVQVYGIIKKIYHSFLKNQDVNNFNELGKAINNEFKYEVKAKNINGIIAHWLLNKKIEND